MGKQRRMLINNLHGGTNLFSNAKGGRVGQISRTLGERRPGAAATKIRDIDFSCRRARAGRDDPMEVSILSGTRKGSVGLRSSKKTDGAGVRFVPTPRTKSVSVFQKLALEKLQTAAKRPKTDFFGRFRFRKSETFWHARASVSLEQLIKLCQAGSAEYQL
jgi:hypothetical protein